jgi:hypothetical protein
VGTSMNNRCCPLPTCYVQNFVETSNIRSYSTPVLLEPDEEPDDKPGIY